MNILFVSSCFPTKEMPQYGIFVFQLAKALIEQNNNVEVLIPESNVDDDYIYEGIKTFRLKTFPTFFTTNLFISSHKTSEKLLSFFKKHSYDCVIAHFADFSTFASLLHVCKKNNIKLFNYCHGLNVYNDIDPKHKLFDAFKGVRKKMFYNCTDGLICVSNLVASFLKKRKIKRPIYVVENGVDSSLFTFRDRKVIHELRIISIGNLFPLKGHSFLITALASFIKKRPGVSVKLDIYGRGQELNNLSNLVSKLGLEEIVTFKGYVRYDTLAQEINNYDVFCLPSYYEAFGCVYLESMSSGLITIGCKGQGDEEFIVNGVNGYLVDPCSPASIVNCFETILNNLPENLSLNGRKTAEHYSWELCASKLVNVLKSENIK